MAGKKVQDVNHTNPNFQGVRCNGFEIDKGTKNGAAPKKYPCRLKQHGYKDAILFNTNFRFNVEACQLFQAAAFVPAALVLYPLYPPIQGQT